MRKIGEHSSNPPPRTSLPLVLYVEDNDDNWGVAEMRLGKIYRLLRASTDRQACELLTKHAGELYVVLMDIELQGSALDGVALTKLLRGRLPGDEKPPYARSVQPSEVPIIFVTAYHTDLTGELEGAGGNLVIPKPVEFMRLIRDLTTMHLQAIGTKAG